MYAIQVDEYFLTEMLESNTRTQPDRKPTFYISCLPDQKSHDQNIFCGYPKSFVRGLSKKEKVTHSSPVKPTAVCRKARNESTSKAKAAPTKHVKHAAVALSLFVVNALENRKISFIVGFAANKYWS